MKTNIKFREHSTFAFCKQMSAGLLFAASALAAPAQWSDWNDGVRNGANSRASGALYDSIAVLESAVQSAPSPAARSRARTQLGLTLEQAGRLADANAALSTAYYEAPPGERYPISLALGNVAAQSHDASRARRYYEEVKATVDGSDSATNAKIAAELAEIRLQRTGERFAALSSLMPRIDAIKNAAFRARALFAVGQETADGLAVTKLSGGAQDFERALRLSYRCLDAAATLAQQQGDLPLAVDAADALSQLYESQGREAEAYELNRQAIAAAAGLKAGIFELPLARLEWRAARLHRARGEDTAALADYLRASQHLESIRQDLPIEDGRGNSTYQTLLKPIFIGLTDLMLRNFDRVPASEQQVQLASALNMIEMNHQAELQDYLGDRCSVDSVRHGADSALPADVAVIYPLILRDRLEIVVRTGSGTLHRSIPVASATLESAVQRFRENLLDARSTRYRNDGLQLYGWLIAPFEESFAKSGVHQLVIVPDGYLRLIPYAALYDGREFLAQRYVISSVTGLTMIEPNEVRARPAASLLAGLSTPGPVVNRLVAMGFTGRSQGRDQTLESRAASLRDELALPGVKAEIRGLAPLTNSALLLDDQFTVDRFGDALQSGRYQVVHMASHGFFRGTAGDSFLLAYDNVIRLDDLQRLISGGNDQATGIDLLTLSACDSATGDDRAPLGFAGSAIKARARSVLGTLWAVNDAATQQFMESFYANISRTGKAAALASAQRTAIRSERFSHPFYWAPFLLTGDWN